MDEVWPEAQSHVARGAWHQRPECDRLLIEHPRLPGPAGDRGAARGRAAKVLTTDGEFHSARRQFARWAGRALDRRRADRRRAVRQLPERFLAAAQGGGHDLIMVSQVLFGSGRDVRSGRRARGARPARRAVGRDRRLSRLHGDRAAVRAAPRRRAFYLGGGYKYAMSGEGCAFLHAPAGFGPRPPVTGWFAEFEDLSLPPGSVGYAKDATPLSRRDLRPVGACTASPRSSGCCSRTG